MLCLFCTFFHNIAMFTSFVVFFVLFVYMVKLFLCFMVFLELLLTFIPPSMMDNAIFFGILLNMNKTYFLISIFPWFELFFSFLVLSRKKVIIVVDITLLPLFLPHCHYDQYFHCLLFHLLITMHEENKWLNCYILIVDILGSKIYTTK